MVIILSLLYPFSRRPSRPRDSFGYDGSCEFVDGGLILGAYDVSGRIKCLRCAREYELRGENVRPERLEQLAEVSQTPLAPARSRRRAHQPRRQSREVACG